MDSLNQKKLLDIMARMRSLVPPEKTVSECAEIDWSVPRHFDVEVLHRFKDLAQKLASFIETTLQDICDDEFNVTVDSITEIFAENLSKRMSDESQNHYSLPISLENKGHVGFLNLPFETCTTLIQQVLCDPEAQIGQEGMLSSLEESILQDNILLITDALIEGFSKSFEMRLQRGGHLVHNDFPLPFYGTEPMSRISFGIVRESIQLELSLYLLDEIVDPSFGISLPDVSPGRLKRLPADITERAHNVGVDISVEMNPGLMALRQIFSLEKDDVVLLDHQIITPANIVINKRACFRAWPAKSDGQLAVVIADKQIKG